MEWWGTVLVIAVLVIIIGLIIFGIVRDHKKGKHSCGGDCGSCHGSCACESGNSPADGNRYKIILKLDGMMCGMCESHICTAIRENLSVKKVKASYHTGEAVVIADTAIMEEDFKKVIEPTGYKVLEYHLHTL